MIRSWMLLLGAAVPAVSDGVPMRTFQPGHTKPLDSDSCPTSCSDSFSKLGGRVQRLEVQERGEPKSGTGFGFEMATGALAHACMYLQKAYGEQSCRIEWEFFNRTMVFDPSQAVDAPGPCPCDDVELVVMTLTNTDKHALPVESGCPYAHRNSLALTNRTAPCRNMSESAGLTGQAGLHRCVMDAACEITDNRLQMSVNRDPRPIAVSTFFHVLRFERHHARGVSVDDFVLDILPTTCKWVAVRYFLFAEVMAQTSSLFWYFDAENKPEEWLDQFFEFVGLNVPSWVVTRAADVAVGRATDKRLARFPEKGIDPHSGGEAPVVGRSYRDEVSPETLLRMDDILRVWLPPPLLEKFDLGK